MVNVSSHRVYKHWGMSVRERARTHANTYGYGRMPIENFTIYVFVCIYMLHLTLSYRKLTLLTHIQSVLCYFILFTFTQKRIKAEEKSNTHTPHRHRHTSIHSHIHRNSYKNKTDAIKYIVEKTNLIHTNKTALEICCMHMERVRTQPSLIQLNRKMAKIAGRRDRKHNNLRSMTSIRKTRQDRLTIVRSNQQPATSTNSNNSDSSGNSGSSKKKKKTKKKRCWKNMPNSHTNSIRSLTNIIIMLCVGDEEKMMALLLLLLVVAVAAAATVLLFLCGCYCWS